MTEPKATTLGNVPIPKKWVGIGLTVFAVVAALVAWAALGWEGALGVLIALLALLGLPVLILTLVDRSRDNATAASGVLTATPNPTACASDRTIPAAPIAPATTKPFDKDAAAGCGCLLIVLLGVYIFFFTTVPPGGPFAFGKPVLDGSHFKCGIEYHLLAKDQYVILNDSPHDLENVHITVVALTSTAERRPTHLFWSKWRKGEAKRADAELYSGEAAKIEQIHIFGYSDTYQFSAGVER